MSNNYEKDKHLIIQSFINFYGADFSEYIIKKISNSDIIWFDSKPLNENDSIYNHINTSLSKEIVDDYLTKRVQDAFLQSAYIDELDLLVLPQSYDLTSIIHEINHKIGSHIISLKPYLIINGFSIEIERGCGIMMQNNGINEVINQLMTLDILEELKILGIDCKITTSWQEQAFPLVVPFYNAFKEQIKKLYISGNIQEFSNYVGIDILKQYLQFVFRKIWKIERQIMRKEEVVISQEDIKTSEDFVKLMLDLQNKEKSL